MNSTGKINFGGKDYHFEIKNGVKYVEGKTIDEFIETLSHEDKIASMKLGMVAMNDMEKGEYCKHPKKYEYLANDRKQLDKEVKKLPPIRLF